jgi:triphosphoribosyl-dephospho-CoA synthase
MSDDRFKPGPGQLARVACILEATARKPGNVHRFADFEDCTYLDFMLSAGALAGPLDRAAQVGVGAAVLEAVEASRRLVATNTNLGMVLLLAPLAAVPEGIPLRLGLESVLAGLTVADAKAVYEAIRLARPGGLGTVAEQDVAAEPTVTLREAMALAADRDMIARQYANGYAEVFDVALTPLVGALLAGRPLEVAILQAFLTLLTRVPDTLIARKRGPEVALEASRRAADALESGEIAGFDAWLRGDGHARNPGATADLITAAIYVALRKGLIPLPINSASWRIG